METIITTKKELALLLRRGTKLQYKFEFPSFTSLQNAYWYRLIHKDYMACGCETGAKFLGVAFLVGLCYHLFNWIQLSKGLNLPVFICTFIFIFLAAVTGKVLGRWNARKSLMGKIKNLGELLDDSALRQF